MPRLRTTLSLSAVFLALVPCPSSSSPLTPACGETREGAEKGIVRPPQFPAGTDVVNCSWFFRAAPGFKLLVRVDNAEFASAQLRASVLRLSVDGQVLEISRNCVDCLESLVAGRELLVQFVSTKAADASKDGGTGSFQIRYKAFNPGQCERPRSPNQGYVFGRDWRLGREVSYHCNPPYDLLGSSSARCIVPEQRFVPEWSSLPPRCALSDCRKGPVHRTAGAGAIASPGFAEQRLPANRKCQWEIQAEAGHQVKAAFTRLRLPEHRLGGEAPHLYLFDGDENTPLANLSAVQIEEGESPLNVTTVSSKLLVVLLTGTRLEEDAVMYMEYAANPSTCPDPGRPDNGELVAYSLAVGSSVGFRCRPGYVLDGDSRAECLPTGTWSASRPKCVLEAGHGDHQDVAVDVHVEDVGQEDLIGILGGTPAPLGGPRGLTPPPVEVTTTSAPPRDVPEVAQAKPSRAKHTPVLKASWSTTTTTSTTASPTPPRAPAESSEEALDPVAHVSGLKPALKEERGRWRTQQQDVHSHGGHRKEPGAAPRKPSAHLDPRPVDDDGDDEESRGEPSQPSTSRDHQGRDGVHRDEGDFTDGLTVTMVAVIVAVTAPLAIAFLLLIVLVIYRRKYPVRMGFGRKFSTFENPMYVKKDAQDPRELARLSAADKDRF